jgi:hypothetical protein
VKKIKFVDKNQEKLARPKNKSVRKYRNKGTSE